MINTSKKIIQKDNFKFSTIAIIVLFILIILFGGLGDLLWQKLNTIEANANENSIQLSSLAINLQNLQNDINSFQKWKIQYQNFMTPALRSRKQNTLYNVEYMVRLANLYVTFGDTAQAANILAIAGHRLTALSDPSLSTVRKKLADDLVQLKSVPHLDTSYLIFQLDAINKQIQALPIAPNQITLLTKDVNTIKKNKVKRWFDAILFQFKQLIIVRHTNQQITALLPTQKILFLKQNINQKILQAEWALLRNQPKLYKHNLKLIVKWLDIYFSKDPSIHPIAKHLIKLHNIDLGKKISDLTPVIVSIQQSMNQITTAQSRKINRTKASISEQNKSIATNKPIEM